MPAAGIDIGLAPAHEVDWRTSARPCHFFKRCGPAGTPGLRADLFYRGERMTRLAKTFLTFTVVLAAVLMAACPQSTTIRDIQNDPGRFRDREVSISGRVVTSFGAGGEGAYEVDDGTGRIWVLTSHGGVPGEGAQVRAVGRVSSGVTFAGRSFATVLRETERHTSSPR